MILTSALPRLLAQHDNLVQQELGFVILLSIAALVAILVRRVRLPYTVALVLVGLALAFFPNFLNLEVSSNLILAILVPPLIFEATLQIRWERLRYDLAPILGLAVIGTLVSTVVVGGIVARVLNVPLPAALAFGALISATDPVAVIAFFRSLGVGKRLAILVEGESLFNDGVAIVIFNLAIAVAVGTGGREVTVAAAAQDFIRVAAGGLALGAAFGYLVSYVILKNVDDHLIETATTLALAYGSFVATEEIGLSGILAVVAAGLVVGNIGRQNTSPTTQISIDNFWELSAFVVNSIVFLVIGLHIEIGQLLPYLLPILVAVVAVLLSRALVVYGLTAFLAAVWSTRAIPHPYRHVMYWGGLRGAISLALALTLSSHAIDAGIVTELQVMTFGVVLFTLVVQGTTMGPLIRRLGLAERSATVMGQQRRQALLYAKMAGMREIERLRHEGILVADVADAMKATYEDEVAGLKTDLLDYLQRFPELEREVVVLARADLLRAERQALAEAAQAGLIGDEVQLELLHDADERIAALELIHRSGSEIGPDAE